MRYYHPFPEAIPLSEAGCSRVTHPSATKNQEQALNSPFDLHVLGVPPAFVLSQDQTLHKFVSYPKLVRLKSCSFCDKLSQTLAITVFFSLVWLLKNQFWNFKNFRIDKVSSFLKFLALFSIVQFSRCSRCQVFDSDSLFIIPHFQKFVKSFFQTFSNFFELWFFVFAGTHWLPSGSHKRLAYYTTFSRICQVFFKNFFKFPNLSDCHSHARQLYYYSTKKRLCQA